MSAPTQEGNATYMGIPVDHIVIMYDYLKNYDGAIDGGFAEGFLAGARYAAEKIQEGMEKAAERSILYGWQNVTHQNR